MSRILLTGFMGCGKSAAGIHLARLLQAPFCDLDERIEALAGESIPQVFSTRGESAFRDLETEALRALPTAVVCALGGGAVTRSANLEWIKNNSLLIYLKVRTRELQARIEKDSTVRPLLFGSNGRPLTGTALTDRISTLLDSRKAFYEQAHFTVETTSLTPLQTAQACARVVQTDSAG